MSTINWPRKKLTQEELQAIIINKLENSLGANKLTERLLQGISRGDDSLKKTVLQFALQNRKIKDARILGKPTTDFGFGYGDTTAKQVNIPAGALLIEYFSDRENRLSGQKIFIWKDDGNLHYLRRNVRYEDTNKKRS